MTTIRATLTDGPHTWISYGSTAEEAVYRLRVQVQRHVITTGKHVYTCEIQLTDVTEEWKAAITDYLAKAYPRGVPNCLTTSDSNTSS